MTNPDAKCWANIRVNFSTQTRMRRQTCVPCRSNATNPNAKCWAHIRVHFSTRMRTRRRRHVPCMSNATNPNAKCWAYIRVHFLTRICLFLPMPAGASVLTVRAQRCSRGPFAVAVGNVNIFFRLYISIFSSNLSHNFISNYFFLSTAHIGRTVETVKHTHT
jgi:hypothetical protein